MRLIQFALFAALPVLLGEALAVIVFGAVLPLWELAALPLTVAVVAFVAGGRRRAAVRERARRRYALARVPVRCDEDRRPRYPGE